MKNVKRFVLIVLCMFEQVGKILVDALYFIVKKIPIALGITAVACIACFITGYTIYALGYYHICNPIGFNKLFFDSFDIVVVMGVGIVVLVMSFLVLISIIVAATMILALCMGIKYVWDQAAAKVDHNI